MNQSMLSLFSIGAALAIAAPSHAAPPSASTTQAAQGIRSFGFSLFRSLYNEKGSEPVAISPLSIAEAMTLATVGSEKKTLTQLEGLFPGTRSATMVSGIGSLRASLKKYAAESNGAFEFTSANALWGNSNPDLGFSFKPGFLRTAGSAYGAKLTTENFKDPATVGNINAWVAANTKNKITKLVGQLGEEDVAVLLNAIYAKGKFAKHFGVIKEGDYTGANGKTVPASYLGGDSYVGYHDDADLTAISLAIGDFNSKAPSDQIALDILVPKSGDLDKLVGQLDGAYYADVVSKMKPQEVDLSIPAGKVEQGEPLSLVNALKAAPFRVLKAFDREQAEFSLLGETKRKYRLFISDVVTKTFYEVTPFGFEAAAATAVTFAAATSVSEPPPAVRVEGPSIHVVRHVPTGTPLFITVYDSPVLYDEAKLIELMEEGAKSDRILIAETAAGTIRVDRDYTAKTSKIVLTDKDGNVIKVLKNL